MYRNFKKPGYDDTKPVDPPEAPEPERSGKFWYPMIIIITSAAIIGIVLLLINLMPK